MIFPSINDNIQNSIINDLESEQYKEMPLFDFEKGDFILQDGKFKLVKNEEALKMMITKLIKTEKFRYLIYARDVEEEEPGIILEKIIGSGYDINFIQNYLKGTIKEEIEKLKGVENVSDMTVKQEDDKIIINCKVNNIFTINHEV